MLDECVPRKIGRELSEHEVTTVTKRGWSGVKNGNLLALAEAEYEVFLTVDRNLKYQQNLKGVNIAIVLLAARNNRLKTLLPLIPELKKHWKTSKQAISFLSAKPTNGENYFHLTAVKFRIILICNFEI